MTPSAFFGGLWLLIALVGVSAFIDIRLRVQARAAPDLDDLCFGGMQDAVAYCGVLILFLGITCRDVSPGISNSLVILGATLLHRSIWVLFQKRQRWCAVSSKVDIGIVTIRDDEFRAVLAAFPDKAGTLQGASRAYTLRHAEAGGGERYRIAVLRLVEQGQGEAQDATRDLIDDLAPRLVLVVGIAGGRPSADVKLGDVVVSTRIHDFTIEARESGEPSTYSVTGGPIDKTLAALIANLAAREDELGDWAADLPKQPTVSWTEKGQLSGPPDWQRELRDTLEHHHGPQAMPRAPVCLAGPIASSDRLVKDPELLIHWLKTARNLLAIEMESSGVYRAARERCPMLAIRGISDMVGLQRADAWTKYACASAAAFTRAFLRTRPV